MIAVDHSEFPRSVRPSWGKGYRDVYWYEVNCEERWAVVKNYVWIDKLGEGRYRFPSHIRLLHLCKLSYKTVSALIRIPHDDNSKKLGLQLYNPWHWEEPVLLHWMYPIYKRRFLQHRQISPPLKLFNAKKYLRGVLILAKIRQIKISQLHYIQLILPIFFIVKFSWLWICQKWLGIKTRFSFRFFG